MRGVQALYSVYVGLVFMLGVTAVIPVYLVAGFLSDRRRLAWMFAANRVAMRAWSWVTGIRVTVEGRGSWGRPSVIVGNHCNMLDMPVCAIACAQPVKVLAKQEFARVPLLGYLFRSFAVLVTRESSNSRQRSMRALTEALRDGWSIMMFPEGTRNRTLAPLQPFRDGAFRAAIEAGVPVQPFVQINSRAAQRHNSLLCRPARITFRWLPPIATEGMTEADVPRLREQVRALLETTLRREDPAFAQRP